MEFMDVPFANIVHKESPLLQLFVLGVIPVCLLVYFNTKIYFDVRERERRRRPTVVNAAYSAATAPTPGAGAPPSGMRGLVAGDLILQPSDCHIP